MIQDTLDAINARWSDIRNQEELIINLGEQIRKAVEILLQSLDEAQKTSPDLMNYLISAPHPQQYISERNLLESLYQAAIQVIMRLVFILFAESRDLLPKRQNLSEDPYSLEIIYSLLEKTLQTLQNEYRESNFAWPQIIVLFRCIYNGNTSSNIKLPQYGGKLFRPGDKESSDLVLRALAIFEDERMSIPDLAVWKILRLLKIVRVKTQRKQTTWVDIPVDFSQIRTEYIGTIYEGLLDYSLRRQSEGLDRNFLSLDELHSLSSTHIVKRIGNRKGTGTFYTKYDLVDPTVQHTLESLVYQIKGKIKLPQKPEEILALKIVDPAMGSASFLVAALEYITNALVESLIYHGNVKTIDSTKKVVLLPLELQSKNKVIEKLITTTGRDEQIDRILRSKLKRHVVENCIYGVDINPLAVELAKLTLWIEIADKKLPFAFLDHNLKVGNALVGCWFDYFQDYPVMAWNREAGDEKHTISVNYRKNEFSQQLKRMRRIVKKQLISGEEKEVNLKENKAPTKSEFIKRKEAFDVWCAIWFWPIDDLENAPQPNNFLKPTKHMLSKVKEIASQINFFHWELEFPDVFERENRGFDAVVGNPPWETIKPLSKEFFSEYDPLYRKYGKQEALSRQRLIFKKSKDIEKNWILYNAEIKAITNYAKRAAFPLGDPQENNSAHLVKGDKSSNRPKETIWNKEGPKRGVKEHPFRYQGHGSPTTYKLFLELGFHILRKRGRLGFIVPSSIYTDLGAIDLRRLFISKAKWEWLISFENRKGIFPGIHKSFKFCILVLKKGEKTDEIKTSFMLRDPMDLKRGIKYLHYQKMDVEKFSPKYSTLIEFQTQKDKEILEKIYSNCELLGFSNQWELEYVREFDMTNDSKHFKPLPKCREEGYEPTIYGYWKNNEGEKAFPLYEGRMIGQFDFSKKGWISGKGRTANWKEIPFDKKEIAPQYLISEEVLNSVFRTKKGFKVCFLDVTSATNERSMIAALLRDFPCGNTAPILLTKSLESALILLAFLNSFIFDYAIRNRLGGLHLNYFLIEESPILNLKKIKQNPTIYETLLIKAASLNCVSPIFALEWLYLKHKFNLAQYHWKQLWSITRHKRQLDLAIINALVAYSLNITVEELKWILKSDRSNPKGFWRVDQQQPEEIRLTALTIAAFEHLMTVEPEDFCEEEWQPSIKIQEELGSYLLEWQLQNTTQQSWIECEHHAQIIIGSEELQQFKVNLNANHDPFTFFR
ncbi:MAG: Eco57I restriction-modification methylase domain-containing protein [Candidatus Hermodarchaeota archaeon]